MGYLIKCFFWGIVKCVRWFSGEGVNLLQAIISTNSWKFSSQASLLLNMLLRIPSLASLTEAFRLLVPHHLSLLWQVFTTCCVNKTTPSHFINGRCHIKQLKAGKSYKTCLPNHTWFVSHHITPLIINAFVSGHTRTYWRMNQRYFKKPGMCGLQVWAHLV